MCFIATHFRCEWSYMVKCFMTPSIFYKTTLVELKLKSGHIWLSALWHLATRPLYEMILSLVKMLTLQGAGLDEDFGESDFDTYKNRKGPSKTR